MSINVLLMIRLFYSEVTHNQITPDFKISVIIPFYNSEKYLLQAINSIVNQSLGFKDNIQLILINDGSTDNSSIVCQKIIYLFPLNVIYLYQENGGASSARNLGLKHSSGKYVVFLDSDDYWETDAFEKMIQIFDYHYDAIDVLAARMKRFDKSSRFHIHDYMFYRTRIVDLDREYDCIPGYVTGAMFKRTALCNITFCTKLHYFEDAMFMGSVALTKRKIGLVREAVYYYRLRSDGTSLIDQQLDYMSHFFNTPVYFHQMLFADSIIRYHTIVKFVQYLVLFDLQGGLVNTRAFPLTMGEQRLRLDLISLSLNQIDTEVLFNARFLSLQHKLYVLYQRFGPGLNLRFDESSGQISFESFNIYNVFRNHILILKSVNLTKGSSLSFQDDCWLMRNTYSYVVSWHNKIYLPTYVNNTDHNFYNVYGVAQSGRIVQWDLPQAVHYDQLIFFFRFAGKCVSIKPFIPNDSMSTLVLNKRSGWAFKACRYLLIGWGSIKLICR